MIDLFFANNFRDPRCRFFMCWNVSSGCASICSSSEIATPMRARPKSRTQNPIHRAPRHWQLRRSLPINSLIFSDFVR